MNLDNLINDSLNVLEKLLSVTEKPLIAYSGGKDAIVVSHIASQMGLKDAVCETSFYFEKQLCSVKKLSNLLNLNTTYYDTQGWEWLKKNKDIVFTSDTKKRSWTFSVRQQRTVKNHAKKFGYDSIIFGRRKDENCVKDTIYKTRDYISCHPLANWKKENIWEYFSQHKIPIPYIYSTKFGLLEGNAPFYTLNKKYVGTIEQCWEIVSSIDPRYNSSCLEEHYVNREESNNVKPDWQTKLAED